MSIDLAVNGPANQWLQDKSGGDECSSHHGDRHREWETGRVAKDRGRAGFVAFQTANSDEEPHRD